ncbi:MAG: ATP-grasp domain-containing protein [Erysipelotrichia bacterium]|nr:ATP-grasp domain-containing protein [Erysipelotrichia bacterium]
MKMKKVLLLGGSRYILPIIEAIHKLGYYAITCDYLPDNIAHKYSDEYYNVSILEKDKVLELAQKLKIDGIMSFACDPGVDVAAYVAEKMGLPYAGSYEAVSILQNKVLFRQFLAEHGFNVPIAKGYSVATEAVADANQFRWPVMVKPVDSAGSKGVTRVDKVEDLKMAADYAIKYSKTNSFIVEEFIEQKGFSSDTDCFSINGRLVFTSFSNQRFDENATNPYTPSAYSWPSTMPDAIQVELRSELQRLIKLLNLKTSIYNIETRQGVDGKGYIMEMSPRGGGNRLSEILHYASGADLVTNAVRAAVGDEIVGIIGDPIYNGFWAEVILHADNDGIFEDLWIDESIKNFVIERDIWVHSGDIVRSFSGANETIGTLVLRFDSNNQLEEVMNNIPKYIEVKTR